MKTTITIIAIMLATLTGMSQKSEYYQVMGECLTQFSTCKSTDDFQSLAYKFKLIADNEKGEWLPLYYHAQCYILMSFMEQQPAKRDAYLDNAEKSVASMIELAPQESEIHTMQGMFYSARLLVNPVERGQKYSNLSSEAVNKALSIEPGNPRARLMQIQLGMGTAKFFGGDVKEYCNNAVELVNTWDSYQAKTQVHPTWGKDQAIGIVKSCNL
jgi:hypothetical protein